MMIKCRHQWDWIGVRSIGKQEIAMNRPKYAVWICPYCEEIKMVKLSL